jgi:hypothetical protein
MTEDQVQVQESQNAVPTPEPSTPTPEPGVDLNSRVDIGGKEIPVSELVSNYGKVQELESYKRAASALMKGDAIATEDREASMRYLLSAEGYTPNQIEGYINETRDYYSQEEGLEEGQANRMEENQHDDTNTPQPVVDEDARRQIDSMQKQNSQMMVDMLRNDLSAAMEKTMASNQSIKTLLDKSMELAGPEDVATRMGGIRDEVQRIALDSMRDRRSRGEKFDKAWFDQETNRAADRVYQRIRSVIGDPDKIQRAPETASDTESFVSKPPVPAPTFEKGDNMGSATDKSHDYTVDALSRLASDLDMGGESRI